MYTSLSSATIFSSAPEKIDTNTHVQTWVYTKSKTCASNNALLNEALPNHNEFVPLILNKSMCVKLCVKKYSENVLDHIYICGHYMHLEHQDYIQLDITDKEMPVHLPVNLFLSLAVSRCTCYS